MSILDKVIGGASVVFLAFYTGAFVQEMKHTKQQKAEKLKNLYTISDITQFVEESEKEES